MSQEFSHKASELLPFITEGNVEPYHYNDGDKLYLGGKHTFFVTSKDNNFNEKDLLELTEDITFEEIEDWLKTKNRDVYLLVYNEEDTTYSKNLYSKDKFNIEDIIEIRDTWYSEKQITSNEKEYKMFFLTWRV